MNLLHDNTTQGKHTPGPWSLAPHQASMGEALCIEDKDATIVCLFPESKEGSDLRKTDEANGALIAAAPDLLEALEALLGDFNALCIRTGTEGVGDHEIQARRAIAKARGEA